MKIFSDRLESLRADLTQKQMAAKIGVPLNTYTNWIRSINVPKADQLQKICTVFGVSSDWLIGLSQAPPSKQLHSVMSDKADVYLAECQECKKKAAQIERLERIIDKLTK